MSELPAHVVEAGLLFHRANIQNDPEVYKKIIDFGHHQINIAYPENPIRAPLNVFRRQRARWEWDEVVRTAGRNLRGTIANAMVRELEFEIQRREQDTIARDVEERRQEAVTFDGRLRIQEYDLTSQINVRTQKNLSEFTHDLQQKAEDAASRRRIAERIVDTQHELVMLTSQAIFESMGTSSANEVLDLVTKVSSEVTRIRHDKTIDDDDKHLHIKTLLDSLPLMLQRARHHER